MPWSVGLATDRWRAREQAGAGWNRRIDTIQRMQLAGSARADLQKKVVHSKVVPLQLGVPLDGGEQVMQPAIATGAGHSMPSALPEPNLLPWDSFPWRGGVGQVPVAPAREVPWSTEWRPPPPGVRPKTPHVEEALHVYDLDEFGPSSPSGNRV